MAQDYSQQFSMFAGDPYGAAINQMNNAPSYGYGPTGLNLNDFTGIMLSNAMEPVIKPTNILSSDDDDYENIERFAEEPDYRNIFQKGYDAYMDQSGTSRGIMNLILSGGNPFAAAAGFFAPQISDGISSLASRLFGNRMDMQAFDRGMQSAMDDTDPADMGTSSFDSAVSAGIQAAEDDI
jgi:hypothetical protein